MRSYRKEEAPGLPVEISADPEAYLSAYAYLSADRHGSRKPTRGYDGGPSCRAHAGRPIHADRSTLRDYRGVTISQEWKIRA